MSPSKPKAPLLHVSTISSAAMGLWRLHCESSLPLAMKTLDTTEEPGQVKILVAKAKNRSIKRNQTLTMAVGDYHSFTGAKAITVVSFLRHGFADLTEMTFLEFGMLFPTGFSKELY
uniref:Uncharacterized protein n=1 Tax=Nelumbo nucifera TaxID=4432 RepID=A0A822XRP6_NELNU|nr:TPA_asm: hypothetical protein HUJ06_022918 [Nelumbo nucifera]